MQGDLVVSLSRELPVLIAGLTLCEQFASTRWIAELFSGRAPQRG